MVPVTGRNATTPVNVSSILGPFVVEALICALLLGVTLVQSKAYFERCANDHALVVVAVAVLWVLHIFHNVCMSYTAYDFTVLQFGDVRSLAFPPWSFAIGAAITGVFSLVVQTYYARQVYILGKRRKLVPFVILVLALTSTVFAVFSSVKGYAYGDFRKFDRFEYGVLIWLSTSAAADLLLTSSLVLYLRKHRHETSFEDTKSLLNQVITNTIENNALTCVIACADAVLFSQYERIGNWHIVLNGMLVGLYYVSFLTSSREDVRPMSSHFAAAISTASHRSQDLPDTRPRSAGDPTHVSYNPGRRRRLSATGGLVEAVTKWSSKTSQIVEHISISSPVLVSHAQPSTLQEEQDEDGVARLEEKNGTRPSTSESSKSATHS